MDKVTVFRKDFTLIQRWKVEISKNSDRQRLKRLHNVKRKGGKRVVEELQQQVYTKSTSIKRYTNRMKIHN